MGVKLPVQNYFTRINNPTPWTRQSDWPVITDTSNEVQFLMSDIGSYSCLIQTQFTRTSGTQDLIIDWGDGTTSTITATSANTSKTYTPGTGTPCSLGYTTFKIRVYFTGTGVSVMTQCDILATPEEGGVNTANRKACNVLEIYYGNGTQTSNPPNLNSSGSGVSKYPNLEYVKLPSVVTWATMTSHFQDCLKLSMVIMPTSASSLVNVGTMFSGCFSLRSISFPSNSTNINGLDNTFFNCYELTSVTLPNTLNSCITLNAAFQNCDSLKNVVIPSINICTTLTTTFSTCNSLEWVKFISLPTFGFPTVVNMIQCFYNCVNLQTVYFPASCNGNANYNLTNTFQTCTNLKQIVFPIGLNPNTCSGTFNTCSQVKSVIFQSAASRLNSMLSTFVNCRLLTNVILPASVSSSGINLGGTFNNCPALGTITIPSSYIITNMFATFSGCLSLKTINWSPGIQNSLTDIQGAFQSCRLLTNITLPTSMTTLTAMNSCFNGCVNLTNVIFPAALNSCTTLSSCFTNCTSLLSVTLPTSMTACSNFDSMFTNCTSLTSITFPATVASTSNTTLSSFSNCVSLKSITFPTTQLTSLTSLFASFSNCTSITTLTNFDKLGSLTTTPLVNMTVNTFFSSDSINIACPVSALNLSGTGTSNRNRLGVVRLRNASAGQWTGTSPQINVSNTTMSTANLVQLFTDMAAQGNVTSKTINITTASGTAGLTAANRLLITSKGWTITG